MEETSAKPAAPTRRRRIWPFLKWGLFAVVIVFVGRRALQLWQDSPRTELHVDVWWLIPATVTYQIGWLSSVWFWRALMIRMHQRIGWYQAIRAYYVGQVGKYVPGKGLVLVLRGSLVKEAGVNPVFAGVTAAYETLVFMWAGSALALALAPLTLPESFWQQMPAFVHTETGSLLTTFEGHTSWVSSTAFSPCSARNAPFTTPNTLYASSPTQNANHLSKYANVRDKRTSPCAVGHAIYMIATKPLPSLMP